ncbi:serine/threonine protein kinase [Streptomyces tanashiensis]
MIGSPPFMSPEQAEGNRLTAASDVFSLGSVLVMAATGRSPFVGSSTLQTLYDVVHAEPDLRDLPAGLRPIVARCLAKDPGARPTPAELLGLLGPVAPVGRQWPPAVYRMIASQRAAIDQLLDGPQDTVVDALRQVEEPGRAGSTEVSGRGEPAETGGSGLPPRPPIPTRDVSAPTAGNSGLLCPRRRPLPEWIRRRAAHPPGRGRGRLRTGSSRARRDGVRSVAR